MYLEEKADNWIGSAVSAFVVVGILVWIWPGLIEPFTFFEFWSLKAPLWDIVIDSWPLYVWGVGASFAFMFLKDDWDCGNFGDLLVSGFFKSLFAGVLEEIAFRWLLFFSAIISIFILDFLLLGFMGVHPIEWLYSHILGPVANFFTLGYLEPYLLNGYGWLVGAAMISSNGRFRNGHSYQGLFGLVNSWYAGMYLHWVVFNYGLLAAICIHFFYNFAIHTFVAVFAKRPGRFR